ncbi:hypothetical protein N0V95_008784 [Ascochyta clinopodiicola]|nr:hypothetical protein N0V95_008784 [Ascochyta clinopodiicola]
MTDFCLQVTDAAELVGKCLVVPVEMYLNPHACIPPIILSNNEHTRIACALWVLKIYYQLRRKFVDRAPDHANLFATAFLRNLKPWQIDQVIVVQRKVSNCYLEHHDSLNHFDQTEFGLLKRLADSQYSIKYHQTLYQARDSTRLIPHFGYYIRALIHPHRRAPSGPAMRAWWHTSNDVGHPSTPSSITTQLRNHAWICSEPTTHTVTTAHSDRYMNICRQLGLFFWDYARLLAWHLPDSDELMTVVDSHPGLSAVILRYSDRPWWEESRFQRATAVERTTQRQILEWTRCPEPCTLEEWLYQKTAKFLLEKGKDPMPRGRIKIGICCTSCGLDGHALGRGYLCPAWDLETQGQSDTSDATSG